MTKKAQNKTKSTEEQAINDLADSVGEFIRYWGFRRIHGKLWALIYTSKYPLSGVELTKSLKVSKALTSLALTELVNYGLITYVMEDGKTKKYVANENVYEVIKNVLQSREKVLIEKALNNYRFLSLVQEREQQDSKLDPKRLSVLGEMITGALIGLDVILDNTTDAQSNSWELLFDGMKN